MADFRFFINRQGPRGPQGLKGEKGDPGNTFTVSEGVNTPTEYTLIFDGGDGNQFETDNLRNPIVDRGGTYVRYDRDNVVQYIGEPDMAVIDETPGIVNLAGKDTENPNASDAVAYELLEKTVDELNTALEGLDDRLDDAEGALEQAQGDITQAQGDIVGLDNRVTTNEGAITSLQSGKADKSTTYTKTEVNNALAGKANAVHTHTVSQITNAGALASQNTVDYQTQVTNKPTIPTVGNGTITLTQGGVTKGTFTTNQPGNSTIDLDAGGGSTLTAGSGINITNDTISVKVDGTTISTNNDGELTAIGSSGDTVAAGDGIVISPNVLVPGEKIIGVYYDGITINKNSDGQLVAIVPDVSHMVTDNTTQSITGTKTYGAGNLKINDLCLADGSKVIDDKGTYVYVGSPGVTTKIKSNNTKLYFNGQSGIDEEIAKVSQLPGAATSSSLGLVQPDNTTIAIDANGVISANIPTPETVDQTYDASSTHAQSGVAIAGAGFMNGSIVQYPLQYLPDTTNVINSLNDIDLTINRVNGDNNNEYSSSDTIRFYDSSDLSITNFTTDPKGLINKSTLGWVEYNFGNNFNLVLTGGIGESGYTRFSTMYPAFFGYYEDDEFIPVIVLSLDQPGYYNYARLKTIVNNTIIQNITTTNQDYSAKDMAIQYQSGVLKFRCVSTYGFIYDSRTTVTLSQSESEEIAKCTHVRVVPITKGNYTTNAYFSPFNTYYGTYYEIYNPSIDVINTEYPKNGQTSIFTNIHPASLSLKYDSNTLGVNANNELYALSSTPSNMVTTDTQQIITGRKDMAIINIQPSGSTGYTNYITPISSGKIAISKDTYYDTTGTSAGILLDFSNPAAITSVAYGGNSNCINMCTQYSNNTAELRFCNGYKANQVGSSHAGIGKYGNYTYIRNNNANDKKVYKITTGGTSSSDFTNFFLEKDMLDGTTIQYNSTSGKVEVIGGGGGSSGVEIDEVESPLIIKSVSAKKYSTPVTDDHLQCHYFNSNPPYNATLSETTDYYLEYTLDNGLNCLVSFLQKGNSGVSYKGLGLQAGYYNGSTFVSVFSITDGTGYQNMYYYDYIKGSGDNYALYSTADQKPNIRVSYDSTAGTLVIGDTANTSNGYSGGSSINVDSGTQAEMAKVNVIRLFAWVGYEAYADGRYIDMSTYTCYNPSRTDYDFHSVVGGSGNTSTLMANFFADSTQQPISGTPKSVLTSSISSDHPMPGDIFDFVTIGASGTEYTAYDTGWFILGFTASANNQYLEVTKPIANRLGVSLDITVFKSQVYGSTTNYIGTSIPVKKGDKITVNYNTGGTNNIIFVPAAS